MPKPSEEFDPAKLLPIVASSIDQLQKCDVWRLMQAAGEQRHLMYEWLLEQRPDLHLDRWEDPWPGKE